MVPTWCPTKEAGSYDRFRVSGWFLVSADDAVYLGNVRARVFIHQTVKVKSSVGMITFKTGTKTRHRG